MHLPVRFASIATLASVSLLAAIGAVMPCGALLGQQTERHGPRLTSLQVAVRGTTGDQDHTSTAESVLPAAVRVTRGHPRRDDPALVRRARDEPSFWKHAGVGLLIGTAAGLTAGLIADSRGTCGMILCSFMTVPLGAAVGSVTGSIVWAVRRAD